MALAKSDTMRMRCSPFEKEEWGKAAGGSGKISEWARAVLNAEAARVNSAPGDGRSDIGAVVEADIDPDKAEKIVSAIAAKKLDKAKVPLSTSGAITPQCPRWMHHRKGTYCGSCAKVI